MVERSIGLVALSFALPVLILVWSTVDHQLLAELLNTNLLQVPDFDD